MIAGILTSLLLGAVALVAGWEYGSRIGDARGILGFVFGALVTAAGLCWTFGW